MSQRLTTATRWPTRLARAALAVLAGVALGLSWQPYGLWPLLLIGIPALTLLVREQRPKRSFGLGYLFGLAMLTVTISWVHVLGAWVAALLIAFEALFFGVLGLALMLVLTPGRSSGAAPPRRRLAAFSSVEIRPDSPSRLAAGTRGRFAPPESTSLLAAASDGRSLPAESTSSSASPGVHLDEAGLSANLRAQAPVSRFRFWPLAAACCWVLVEFAYARVPFGGFGWTRIAYAAVDTPLAGFFPIIGVAGVSFVVALVGQLIAWVALSAWTHRRLGRRLVAAAASVAVLLGAGGALTRFQVEPLATGASVNVGIVQGNIPGRGIEALGRARSVTNNHLSETVDLMTRTRLGQTARPDFLLWPENSTDIDPNLDAITRGTVQAATQLAGVPILVGAVTAGPGADERQTSALWWDGAAGVTARYDKRNLVPFGEWIPFRRQLLPIVPILAEVGAQSVPGTRPGVLDVTAAGRPLRVGDVICFELAYDGTVYDAVRGGAQVLMVQSNNATYGGTGQIEQQFAITRARAMETRREIAVATTNSVSGYLDRDGHVVHRTTEFAAASLVVSMPERSALTPALTVAPWLERGLAFTAVLCCAFAVWRRRRTSAVVGNNRDARPEPVGRDDERDAQKEAVR